MGQNELKCYFCGQYFDRNTTDFVQVKNIGKVIRYGHTACEEDYYKIHNLVKEKLGQSYAKDRIDRQIYNFVDDGMSLKLIYNILYYWYEVKKESPSRANGGIGIVPYIKAEFLQYVEKRKRLKNLNKDKELKDYIGDTKIIEKKIDPHWKIKGVKFFHLT